MPHPKKTCAEPGCSELTNGLRCPFHAKFFQRKHNLSRSEYARQWTLTKKFGLSLDDFECFWLAQRGRCFICDRLMRLPLQQRGQPMDVVAVDHDHKTGKVRGLLCNACNKGLGHFNDDPELLDKARKYLTCEN